MKSDARSETADKVFTIALWLIAFIGVYGWVLLLSNLLPKVECLGEGLDLVYFVPLQTFAVMTILSVIWGLIIGIILASGGRSVAVEGDVNK